MSTVDDLAGKVLADVADDFRAKGLKFEALTLEDYGFGR